MRENAVNASQRLGKPSNHYFWHADSAEQFEGLGNMLNKRLRLRDQIYSLFQIVNKPSKKCLMDKKIL